MAVIVKPAVSAKGVDLAEAQEIAASLTSLGDDEFASNGVEYDTREEANKTVAKFIRVIESRYDVTLRSRTWEPKEGKWLWGIRPKPPEAEGESATEEEGEPAATEGEGAGAGEPEKPETEKPRSRTGRKEGKS